MTFAVSLYDVSGVLVALVVVFIAYFKWCYTYWQSRDIRTMPPIIPLGNMYPLLAQKASIGQFYLDAYSWGISKGLKHMGVYAFSTPVYVPLDPEIIKHILLTDFKSFNDRGFYYNEKADPLSANLLTLHGDKWKMLRTKMSPAYTSGQLKIMFETMVGTGKKLEDILKSSNLEEIDVKELVCRFTTDIIVPCAFGVNSDSLRNPDETFRQLGRKMFEPSLANAIRLFVGLVVPQVILNMINLKPTRPDIGNFFMDIITTTVKTREENQIYRKDLMHLLIQLKNIGFITNDGKIRGDGEQDVKKITANELAAEAFIFFMAGFETSATTMTMALFELATNQDIQDKTRNEIKEILEKHEGQLTYESLTEMTYLQKVIDETLRKYPPTGILNRVCTSDTTIPEVDTKLKKGTQVVIPILGLQRDPKFYPNPDLFDPERFSEENKKKRPQFTYMPFGDGPRICMGLRMAILKVKIGLSTILKNYKVCLNPKTKTPITLDPRSFFISIKGGTWLDFKPLDE